MLFVDSDELLHCQSSRSHQMLDHFNMIQTAIVDNYEEIQIPRFSYFSRINANYYNEHISSLSYHKATEMSLACMKDTYDINRSVIALLDCWSTTHQEDKRVNPKSIDMSSHCPFHYNHYSCAIHKAYRREKYRCHCNIKKVNHEECRIVHLNNKFIKKYLRNTDDESSMSIPLSAVMSYQ